MSRLIPKPKELAINGGPPLRTAPWTEERLLTPAEKKAATDVLDSGYLSLFEGSHNPDAPFSFWGGPQVQAMEKAWCEYYSSSYAVSMNSATSGLYAAVGALGLGYGDEIIVSPFTMSACAAAPLIYGAIPLFADVDLETGCLDPNSVESLITPRTKAVLVVHQFGNPARMDCFMALAKKYDLKIIEDCAQAHGARFRGKSVGTLGDIGVFSLNVNKTIQTGEGGICLTQNKDLQYRLALIRNHGEAVVEDAKVQNITNLIGFNYRLTEMQAAIGLEQLKRLDEINQVRIEYRNFLDAELMAYDFLSPMPKLVDDNSVASAYCYTFRFLNEKASGLKRADFVKALCAENIEMVEGYVKPLYLEPIYQRKEAFKQGYPFAAPPNQHIKTNYFEGSCPNAEKLHNEEIVLNGHVRPPHSWEDMQQIIAAIKKVIHATI